MWIGFFCVLIWFFLRVCRFFLHVDRFLLCTQCTGAGTSLTIPKSMYARPSCYVCERERERENERVSV